ncbi:uncharacterized protein LOC124159232 [Ischnura elegans]|uniref:uncharacterized protein LOC124159232 n=1 Tax=Ischnura elegans TaxID=197161 RepID=UPI001ED8767F|nr:uncharacterized protein LOC124159232 [Ischnura elegans]
MPPNHASPASFLLPLLVFAALWSICWAAPDVSQLDRTLSLPEPSPSPAPAHERLDPLRDPKVRRALIRALARSLQNLGGDKVEEGERAPGSTAQPPHMVRFHASLGTRTTATFRTVPEVTTTTTESAPLVENNFLPRSILEQVDKQFEKAEFLRVHPDEVLVTSKTEPRPFSLNSFGNSLDYGLSTPTIDEGNSNSLSDEEHVTTTPPPTTVKEDDLRIEQHEIKSFVPSTASDSASAQDQDGNGKTDGVSTKNSNNGSNVNTVDIFKAPLIAAFTVHQDYETGATRGVVPLLPVINQASTSSPLASSTPQGNSQTRLPPNFPLPSDELQDLVRQIATHPASSKSGRFPFSSQSAVQQQRFFNQQTQRLPEKQNLIYFHSAQRGFSQGVPQNLQLGSIPAVHRGLQPVINSPSIHPVRGDFSTEQQQLQQSFQRIQTLQELQQLQARLDRLQRQVQGG